jgi:hypothetical protein
MNSSIELRLWLTNNFSPKRWKLIPKEQCRWHNWIYFVKLVSMAYSHRLSLVDWELQPRLNGLFTKQYQVGV